jgi:hypothetical protein
VPWDGGTTNRAGARHGPREIRNMSSLIRRVHHASRISPFELCERKERREIVDELLSGLSDKDRQFVTLYFSNGLSPEAVAEAMNISITAGDLYRGKRIDCKDIVEMVAIEEQGATQVLLALRNEWLSWALPEEPDEEEALGVDGATETV